METSEAVLSLGALSQETRLNIFKALIRQGPEGLPAGTLGTLIDVPGPTLSFHLKELLRARLVSARREGRHIFYAADYGQMQTLVRFLLEDCCQKHPQIYAGLLNNTAQAKE